MENGELIVSNVDGDDDFNLSDLQLPSDELPAEELPADMLEPLPEVEVAPTDLEMVEPVEGEVQEEATSDQGPAAEAPPPTPRKSLPPYADIAAASGIGAVLVGLGVVGLIYISTAVFLIAVAAVFYTIWRNRATCSIYNVLLACALVAVLLSLYFLWIEIGRYHFDLRARDAKQGIGLFQPHELPRLIKA